MLIEKTFINAFVFEFHWGSSFLKIGYTVSTRPIERRLFASYLNHVAHCISIAMCFVNLSLHSTCKWFTCAQPIFSITSSKYRPLSIVIHCTKKNHDMIYENIIENHRVHPLIVIHAHFPLHIFSIFEPWIYSDRKTHWKLVDQCREGNPFEISCDYHFQLIN